MSVPYETDITVTFPFRYAQAVRIAEDPRRMYRVEAFRVTARGFGRRYIREVGVVIADEPEPTLLRWVDVDDVCIWG